MKTKQSPLEQKIIDKIESLLFEESGGSDDYGNCMVNIDKSLPKIKQFILTSLQQQREETIKWIVDILDHEIKNHTYNSGAGKEAKYIKNLLQSLTIRKLIV